MGTSTKRIQSVLAIGLMAALLTALFKSMDNFTVHHLITDADRFVAAFTYLIIGSWTVTIVGFILAPTVGRFVDKEFTKIIVRDAVMHQYALLAGVFAAVSTFFTLLAYQAGDPSALVALSGAVLIYIGVYDAARTGNGFWKRLALPVLAAVVGSGMAAYTGHLATTVSSLVLMLVFANSTSAISEILEQRGLQRTGTASNCSISLMLWRFLWMAVSATVIGFAVTGASGKADDLVDSMVRAIPALPFVILTMGIVFFAIGLKMVMKRTALLSAALLTLSSQVLFAYPITIVGELVRPGLFGGISDSFVVWAIRIMGAGILIWGILQIKQIDMQIKTAK